MSQPITICSPHSWNYADSYGLIACQLARHMTELGAYVNCTGLGKVQFDSQPADVQAITAQPVIPADGAIFLGWPTTFASHSNLSQQGKRIAVTMFESTKLPAGWVDILNTMDAVIVPAKFCKTIFQDNGVTVPIHVIPLGVSEVYQPAERDHTRKPMRFLAFLDRGARKGGDIALKAFQQAFGNDPNYRLILKARRRAEEIHLFPVGNVEVIHADMSEAELCELYQSCDVLIAPTRGEGFGLLPREFAATGGLALATNWGGTADDIDRWGWSLPYDLVPADWSGQPGLEGQDLGKWALPRIDELVTMLQYVVSHKEFIADASCCLAPLPVHKLYSWRKFAEQVYAIWQGN